MVAEMTVETPNDAASEPVPGAEERKLVRGAITIVALLAVPTAGIAYAAAGWSAAGSALLGLGFVLVMFAGSAGLLARSARRRGNGVWPMVIGLLLRLPLYLVALAALNQVSWVHARALALATVVAVAVTLAYELRLIARSPRMFWIDPEAAAASGVADATRS